ncbi:hypothetical protein [Actinoplanes siamensis]|uniref:Uncharacterized protein n=1 Tax=Actinoplanes siamensis TaxID=1223317 RepID=A0A919NAP4_9ACTN|nr:hypothetical protein [Actinoplanes siamensis]GIF07654.1 hypothetical protein Asi03nite_51920 [Actinoplanes siamensis]
MSPHSRHLPLAVGALLLTALTAACGSPPAPPASLPVSAPPPSAVDAQPSVALPPPTYVPFSPGIPGPGTTYAPPTYAYPPTFAYPTTTAPTSTQAPLTKSPTPTPAHAPKCTGRPTGAEILTLIKGKPGIPSKTLQVQGGPYCSGTWSFTTVKLAGTNADQQEPLMVVATGQGSTLALVAAGSDVCNATVQASSPAGIRVLACGF